MSATEEGGVVEFAPGEVQLSDLYSGKARVAERNTGEILLLHHVGQLRTLCEAAEQSARVKFIAPGDTEGRIREGTVRHFVRGVDPSQWTFLGSDIDVRDAYLRITLSSGLDAVYPVRDLMRCVEDGEFVIASQLI